MLLIETIVSRLRLEESTSEDNEALLTLKGTFAEYGKRNKNGRDYSEQLWDNVLNDPEVQDLINRKVLYGELDHPFDRSDVVTEKAAFAITELHKNTENKTIEGTAKVLDTPAGKILYTLLKFGSVLGMSSRGEGVVNGTEVDPDSYRFITFDVVTNPSNTGALPGVVESVNIDTSVTEKALLESVESANEEGLKIIEEASTSLSEESATRIINKVGERKKALAEVETELDSQDPEQPADDEPAPTNDEVLLRIEEKLDRILALLEPKEPEIEEPSAGPEDSDELVDAPVIEERTVRKVLAKRAPLVENTDKRSVRKVTRVVLESSTEEQRQTEEVAKIVAKGKTK